MSAQHSPDVSLATIRNDLIKHVIRAVIPEHLLTVNTKLHLNPCGSFIMGGPMGDAGKSLNFYKYLVKF